VNPAIRALVAVDEGVDHSLLTTALPSQRVDIQMVGIVDGLEEGWATLQETPTDLFVIACTGYSDRVLFMIEGSVKQREDLPVVVLVTGPPDGFVRRIFEAGADDILALPTGPEEVAFAFEKAVARKQGTTVSSGVALAPMIVVLGPKGGTGKTVTTANLAVGLAEAGHRVTVVDLDLQFGDVGLALGLTPDKTLYDLVKAGGSLDADKISAYLAVHPSGARVLMAPTRPDHAGVIRTEFLREIYATLRTVNDYVIVDTPPGFTPEVIASIDSSSDVVVVGMLDSLSLKNTKLGLETLELMGYPGERIKLILNRADSRVGITQEDVRRVIGRLPDIMVPSDREIARSVNEGTPIVSAKPRSEAAKSYQRLAAIYNGSNSGAKNGRIHLRRKKS
jgi:pilus assembly protein CpaE